MVEGGRDSDPVINALPGWSHRLQNPGDNTPGEHEGLWFQTLTPVLTAMGPPRTNPTAPSSVFSRANGHCGKILWRISKTTERRAVTQQV